MQERNYYEAYDDRYRQVHGKALQWFSNANSKIVDEVIEKYKITTAMKLLEIGCGEGRDAIHLLKNGYDLLATDISPVAVDFCRSKCPEKPEAFRVLDCLSDRAQEEFDFIYAIAVLHVLVLDEDRARFFRFIRERLSVAGVALICTMGDGKEEWNSNISTAFDLQPRIHDVTGEELHIAGTSCRKVSFDTLHREIADNNLLLAESGMTSIDSDFPVIMYAVVKRKELL